MDHARAIEVLRDRLARFELQPEMRDALAYVTTIMEAKAAAFDRIERDYGVDCYCAREGHLFGTHSPGCMKPLFNRVRALEQKAGE